MYCISLTDSPTNISILLDDLNFVRGTHGSIIISVSFNVPQYYEQTIIQIHIPMFYEILRNQKIIAKIQVTYTLLSIFI